MDHRPNDITCSTFLKMVLPIYVVDFIKFNHNVCKKDISKCTCTFTCSFVI